MSTVRTILIVDDDPLIVRVTIRALGGQHRALCATRPDEALGLLAKEDVDVLITDVLMPGMGGVELARKARAVRPGLQVIFMSGYPRERLAQAGVEPSDTLLQKPFEPAMLRAMVAR